MVFSKFQSEDTRNPIKPIKNIHIAQITYNIAIPAPVPVPNIPPKIPTRLPPSLNAGTNTLSANGPAIKTEAAEANCKRSDRAAKTRPCTLGATFANQ
jgi:hypothetical protein